MKVMTEGTPWKLVFQFSVPLLIGGVFQQVYNLIDTMVVGRYLGETALAGVGSTGNLNLFLLALVMGMCNGAGIIVAQCFGAGQKEQLKNAVVAIVWVAGVLSAFLAVIGVAFAPRFLRLLAVPENAIGYSVSYIRIIFLFLAGNVLYNGCGAILRSFGDSRTPLYALMAASVLNMFLDVIFIVQFQLSVAGAALATVIAQHVSGIWCLVYLIRKRAEFGLVGLRFLPQRQMIFDIVRIGVPTAFQSCLISIGGMSVQRLINSFGVAVMAAYTAASKIDSIAIQVICSLGTALSVFTGQNMGVRDFERIQRGLRGTLAMSMIAAVIIAAGAFGFGTDIMRLFLGTGGSAEAIRIGAQYLAIMGVAYVICGIMQSYQNVIRGSGDVNTCMVAGMTELAGRVIFSYLLASQIGVVGIWIATPLSWACGCIVPVVRYYGGKWKNKGVIEVSG